MGLFDYNINIPDGPNNPSVDQPKMKVNTNSIASLIDVDHFGFNQNNGGLHKQTNFIDSVSGNLLGNSLLHSNLQNGVSVPWAQNSLTNLPLFSGAGTSASINGSNFGYTSLLGGLIVQWGFVNPPGGKKYFDNGDQGIVTFSTISGAENIQFPLQTIGVWTSVYWSTNPVPGPVIPPENASTIVIDQFSINAGNFAWIFNGTIGTLGKTGITRFFYLALGF